MNTKQAIQSRQSCRSFTGEQITAEECSSLLEAANAAPIAAGIYEDVKLTVIQDRKILEEIERKVSEIMPALGKHPMYNAPAVILVSGKKREDGNVTVSYCNASCIIENILLEATELELGSVYLYATAAVMQKSAELCELVHIHDGFFPVAMAAVGKSNNPVEMRTATTKRIDTTWL